MTYTMGSSANMTMTTDFKIREILKHEYSQLGKLMVTVYSQLEGFPKQNEQPEYYKKLASIGFLNEQSNTKVLVAVTQDATIVGGVVYFSDMSMYGSGGTATQEKNASGIRLLGIDANFRNCGVGKALTEACINLAKANKSSQVILHTTQTMQIAWKMYSKMGFTRSTELDFMQGELPVFGFRLKLDKSEV